jgi:hypothetical protein
MSPTFACLAFACVGVNFGYQPGPKGGLELLVQISPETFQSLRPGDPISVAVTGEAQQVPPSQITVRVDNEPLPHRLPQAISSPAASAPPAVAPNGPAAPIRDSRATPANATMPIASPGGPSLGAPDGQTTVRVAPPGGTPVTGQSNPAMASQSVGGASDSGQAGASRIPDLAHIGIGGDSSAATIDRPWLAMCLFVIALAASNGYVGWLFYDARQRYLGLLSRTFATAK